MSINMPASYQAQTIHRFPLLGSQIRTACQKFNYGKPQCHPPHPPQASFKANSVSLFQNMRHNSFLLAFTAVLYALRSNYNIVKHQKETIQMLNAANQ